MPMIKSTHYFQFLKLLLGENRQSPPSKPERTRLYLKDSTRVIQEQKVWGNPFSTHGRFSRSHGRGKPHVKRGANHGRK